MWWFFVPVMRRQKTDDDVTKKIQAKAKPQAKAQGKPAAKPMAKTKAKASRPATPVKGKSELKKPVLELKKPIPKRPDLKKAGKPAKVEAKQPLKPVAKIVAKPDAKTLAKTPDAKLKGGKPEPAKPGKVPANFAELKAKIAAKTDGKKKGTGTEPGQPGAPDKGDPDAPLLDMSDAAVRKMVTRAKQRGYVTYDELNRVLPSDKVSSEQIEDTMSMLNEMGINVIESEEQEEGENAELPAVQAGHAVAEVPEKPAETYDRTDDPVRMYLREMGSVELLSREGEIAIAKRIEAGRELMIGALCEGPLTFEALTVWRDELNEGKALLRDIIDLEAMYGGVPGPDGAIGQMAPAGAPPGSPGIVPPPVSGAPGAINGGAPPQAAVAPPPPSPVAPKPAPPKAAGEGGETAEGGQSPEGGGEPGLDDDFDDESNLSLSAMETALKPQVLATLDRRLPEVEAVIVLDQVVEDDCGVITAAMRVALAERARRYPQVLFWADSRKHIREFRNMLIKPNQFESVGHANPLPDERIDLERLKAELPALRATTQAPVCVTLGERGLMVSDPVPTFVRAVRVAGPIDPTGAGDSVTAGMVLSLISGATMPEAALIGNLVASITVQQLATTGVARPDELPPRLEMWRGQ